MPLRIRSLQSRFLILVIAGAGLFALVAGAVTYRFSYQQAIESGTRAISDLVGAIERTAAVGAYTGDELLLQEVIDGLAHNEAVAQVSIANAEGLEVKRQTVRQPGPGGIVIERQLDSPFNSGEAVGRLRVEANVGLMERRARDQAAMLALLMVSQIALIAGLLYVAAARFVSRPIVRMARALSRVPPGASDRLAVPDNHRQDEIGVLIGGANALLDATERAIQRERALHAEVLALQTQRQIADAERKREQAVAREREHIVQELHDGLGSRLSTCLALANNPAADRALVSAGLRECIDDLKLTVDVIEPVDGSLVALIAAVRYRLEKRFAALGVRLEWRVNELPALPWMETADAVSIMRIFQEALANAIKHAQPKVICVATAQRTHDGRAGVEITIADDGSGFDPQARTPPSGRGLNNMRARAAALGGTLELQSRTGATTVRLWLPLERTGARVEISEKTKAPI